MPRFPKSLSSTSNNSDNSNNNNNNTNNNSNNSNNNNSSSSTLRKRRNLDSEIVFINDGELTLVLSDADGLRNDEGENTEDNDNNSNESDEKSNNNDDDQETKEKPMNEVKPIHSPSSVSLIASSLSPTTISSPTNNNPYSIVPISNNLTQIIPSLIPQSSSSLTPPPINIIPQLKFVSTSPTPTKKKKNSDGGGSSNNNHNINSFHNNEKIPNKNNNAIELLEINKYDSINNTVCPWKDTEVLNKYHIQFNKNNVPCKDVVLNTEIARICSDKKYHPSGKVVQEYVPIQLTLTLDDINPPSDLHVLGLMYWENFSVSTQQLVEPLWFGYHFFFHNQTPKIIPQKTLMEPSDLHPRKESFVLKPHHWTKNPENPDQLTSSISFIVDFYRDGFKQYSRSHSANQIVRLLIQFKVEDHPPMNIWSPEIGIFCSFYTRGQFYSPAKKISNLASSSTSSSSTSSAPTKTSNNNNNTPVLNPTTNSTNNNYGTNNYNNISTTTSSNTTLSSSESLVDTKALPKSYNNNTNNNNNINNSNNNVNVSILNSNNHLNNSNGLNTSSTTASSTSPSKITFSNTIPQFNLTSFSLPPNFTGLQTNLLNLIKPTNNLGSPSHSHYPLTTPASYPLTTPPSYPLTTPPSYNHQSFGPPANLVFSDTHKEILEKTIRDTINATMGSFQKGIHDKLSESFPKSSQLIELENTVNALKIENENLKQTIQTTEKLVSSKQVEIDRLQGVNSRLSSEMQTYKECQTELEFKLQEKIDVLQRLVEQQKKTILEAQNVQHTQHQKKLLEDFKRKLHSFIDDKNELDLKHQSNLNPQETKDTMDLN